MKKIFFRVDMNNTIATGHVMRCLSIAAAAKKKGIESIFFLADEQAKELINSKGFTAVVLNTPWDNLEEELLILKEYLIKMQVKKLVVDSYRVTPRYLQELSKATQIYYIDDLNAFLYPVHGIICYANYWEKFNYKTRYEEALKREELSEIPDFIVGCKYVPLREEFQNRPKKIITEKIENILILSGGTDNLNIFENILANLSLKKYKEINVVCGKYYKNYEDLKSKFSGYSNVFIYKQLDNLIDYMQKADVAISAGGTTLYELCAVGTPTIAYSFVDNQLGNVRKFSEDGIIRYAGDVRWDSAYEKIAAILEKEYNDCMIRQNISEKMRSMIDGYGSLRIVERIQHKNKNRKVNAYVSI